MRLDLSIDIQITDDASAEQQVQKIVLDGKTVYIKENPPSYNSLTGQETNTDEITLTYDIDNGGGTVSKIEYSRDGGQTWIDTGTITLQGTIVVGGLTAGNIYEFILRATNETGAVESNTLSVFLSGDLLIFGADFEDVGKVVDDFWRDDNNGDPIAGGNVRIKENFTKTGKDVQISYLAWNQGNGVFRGTRRLEHPFAYFNLEPARAYELSVDWYFEDIWDFNTIGRDTQEMLDRLVAHGRWDGANKIEYDTEADAQDYLDTIVGGDESMGPGTDYYDTGFPYQTGKLHGLVSSHDGDAPAGSQPREPDEWSARVVWVKDTNSHPTRDGNGVYTDGADPNVPPKLAIYLYDQDRDPEGDGGEPGRYVIADNFTSLAKETWYTIKLFVQINEKGKSNGIAKLTIIDRATSNELGSAYVDDVKFHDAADINNALVERLFFSTFFGGGNLRYSPKIDDTWASEVDVNSAVYARNDNYKATRLGALQPPTIVSESYSGSDIELTVEYPFTFSEVDDVEYNVTPASGTYDPTNWTSASYSVTNEQAIFTIAGVSSDDTVRVRIDREGRKSARSDMWTVDVPSVPDAPAIDSVEGLDGELKVTFFASADNGNSPITKYQYRVDGGTIVDLSISGNDFTTETFSFTSANGSPLVNGNSYDVEVRAVNAIGESEWSDPVSQIPVPPFNFPVPTNGLVRYWDAGELSLNDGDTITSVEDKTENSNLSVMGGVTGPTYKTSIVNGEPVMRFDGVSNALEDNGGGLGNVTDECSLYIVASATAEDQQGSLLSTSPWDTANILNVHSPYTLSGGDQKIAWDFGDRGAGGRLLDNWPANTGEFHIWEFRVKAGLMSVYKNGNLQYVTTESSTTNLANKVLRMGWSPDGFFSGDIAICLPYSRYLATDEQDRIDILNYLGTRYGITVNTPSAPSINSISTTPNDGQVTIDWSVEENGSSLTKIELETDGTWEILKKNDGSNYVDPEGSFIKLGLTNDDPADFRLRFTNSIGVTTSSVFTETPTESADIRVDSNDHVDSGDYTDMSDTERIDSAIFKAQQEGVAVIFGSREYNYSGSKSINSPVTLQGTQPIYGEYEDPSRNDTVINMTGTWSLNAPLTINGIWMTGYHGGSYHTNRIFYMNEGSDLIGDKCYISGVESTYSGADGYQSSSNYGIVIQIVSGAVNPDIILTNSKVFDAHHDVDIETVTPLLRLIQTSGDWKGNLDFNNVQLYDCGHKLEWKSGNKDGQLLIKSNVSVTGINDTSRGNEVDMLNINRDGTGVGVTKWRDVTMWGCPLAYIKNSEGHGRWDIDGLTFRVKGTDTQRQRMVRMQAVSSNDFVSSGIWKNVTFEFDDASNRIGGFGNTQTFRTSLINVSELGDGALAEGDGFLEFENIYINAKGSGTLTASLLGFGRSAGNECKVRLTNVYTNPNGRPIRHLLSTFKAPNDNEGSADDRPIYIELIDCTDMDIEGAWFYDEIYEATYITNNGGFFGDSEDPCRVWDTYFVKLSNATRKDGSSLQVDVKAEGTDGVNSNHPDIYLANSQANWQTESNCFGTPQDARSFTEY